MTAQFICHSDFENAVPLDVFHKEMDKRAPFKVEDKFRNRHILFRKKANFAKTENAILRITADDYYKLYINGRFVTQGPAPSYPSSYYYNEIDVSDYLCEGENTFAVHTYYQGLVNRVWVSGDMRESLWFSLEIDGVLALVSDDTWLCADHTAYSIMGKVGYDTAFLERYDSRASEVGFEKFDFNDKYWAHAAIYKNADYKLSKQPTKQLEIYDVSPAEMRKTEVGFFADFGREMVGYPVVRVKGNVGDVIVLHLGEELNEDGTVRFDLRCNCRYEEEFILSGKDDVLSQYDYKAFRYAEIIVPEGVEILDISMKVRHYPYEEKAVYKTENAGLKRILRLCADTVKYGVQEVFVDCPTREKGQYLGDVSIAARAQAALTHNTDMMKKAIINFCRSSFISEGIMAVSTSSYMQEIADYSLQFPAQICWVYSMDGDKEFVKQVLPYAEGVYNYFLRYTNEQGLLDCVDEKWNLVDWPANLRDGYDFPLTIPVGKGVHNVINAFWCGFLNSLDELYGILGLPSTGRTQSVKQAYIDAFYSEEIGLFCDTPTKAHAAIHSNVLPLLFDVCSDNEPLCERIIAFIEEKKLSSMGVYMAYFTLAALIKQGKRELAEKLATDEGCWLLMLSQGATTTFEAWGKEQKGNCSLFHPWATAPLIVFADGVRPY